MTRFVAWILVLLVAGCAACSRGPDVSTEEMEAQFESAIPPLKEMMMQGAAEVKKGNRKKAVEILEPLPRQPITPTQRTAVQNVLDQLKAAN